MKALGEVLAAVLVFAAIYVATSGLPAKAVHAAGVWLDGGTAPC